MNTLINYIKQRLAYMFIIMSTWGKIPISF